MDHRQVLSLVVITFASVATAVNSNDIPKFGETMSNVTTSVGRDATVTCVIDNLGPYKVAWLFVSTQTILTIDTHVITKNHRIAVTHTDRRTWLLQIKDVREVDRGWYMCQINTDPMKSQVSYLEVVVPPDILDHSTSADMVVGEGTNVTLRCEATGYPNPTITWRREDGQHIQTVNGEKVASVEGPELNIVRVARNHMGAYLCIAFNSVPPSVSKRIRLTVHFPPMIWIPNQLVGAYESQEVTLECHSEAYPMSINYWTRENGHMLFKSTKYDTVLIENAYKIEMKLTIHSVGPTDFGSYRCVSKNSLGDTEGKILLYSIPPPFTMSTPSSTVDSTITIDIVTMVIEKQIEKGGTDPSLSTMDIVTFAQERDLNLKANSLEVKNNQTSSIAHNAQASEYWTIKLLVNCVTLLL